MKKMKHNTPRQIFKNFVDKNAIQFKIGESPSNFLLKTLTPGILCSNEDYMEFSIMQTTLNN
jgi:hypothetical protein